MMMKPAVAAALEEIARAVPPDRIVVGGEKLEAYGRDESDLGTYPPDVAVLVERAEEVQAIFAAASRHRVPVIPVAARSGKSGGVLAVEGGIAVSLERMDRILEISPEDLVARVEPGVITGRLQAEVEQHGLFYPPDPNSLEMCTIGGNVAENAGGPRALKYGVTREYVLGLTAVLPTGEIVRLGKRSIKGVAGYDLTALLVGSEGTLGIVTRAILRLVPSQGARSTMVATFATVTAAAEAVVAIRTTMRPCLLELMDRATTNAVEDFRPMGLDRSVGAILIGQSDAPGEVRSGEIAAMQAACSAAGAGECFVTDDAEEGEMFVQARRISFHALEARGALLLEDVGVPIPLLPDLLGRIVAISEAHDVEIPTVAHAGDGNTHPLIVYDPGDADSERRARSAFTEVMSAAIALGGTITGEHGVGRAKAVALPDQLGPDVMALTRKIKDALDPDGILNPGAILANQG
jgi:glycolate oxidase